MDPLRDKLHGFLQWYLDLYGEKWYVESRPGTMAPSGRSSEKSAAEPPRDENLQEGVTGTARTSKPG